MRTVLVIAAAGAVGVAARYGLDGFVSSRVAGPLPWGTILINVGGAFCLGFLYVVLGPAGGARDWLRLALTVGFLGGFTTFSTFSLQTLLLIESGASGWAAANAVGSVLAGLAAAFAGASLARALPVQFPG